MKLANIGILMLAERMLLKALQRVLKTFEGLTTLRCFDVHHKRSAVMYVQQKPITL